MAHGRRTASSKTILCVRSVLFTAAFMWGGYFLTGMRTMGWGPEPWWSYAYLAGIFVLPFAVLPALGMPCRRALTAVVLLCVAASVFAETYAGLQEAMFRRTCARGGPLKPTNGWVIESRWWPFEGSYICYDPATGVFGGGD